MLTRADLRRASLSWANLDAANLTGANLEGTHLDNASLRDTHFGDSNWWRARGLTSATMERFKVEFAPSEDAPPGYRKDFEKWMAGE